MQAYKCSLKGMSHNIQLKSHTCSGVAVMGLGICGACVAEVGLRDGFGVPAAGEAGARYFIMAGSTSGVPWKTKYPPRNGYCCVNVHMCWYRLCVSSVSPSVVCG